MIQASTYISIIWILSGKSTLLIRIINPTNNSHLYTEQINDCIRIRSIPYREEICYEEEDHDQANGSIGF